MAACNTTVASCGSARSRSRSTPRSSRRERPTLSVLARAQEIRHDLGDPELVLLGVDRLDYTKGIDQRVRAVGELFEEATLRPAEHVMVQIAVPSREDDAHYQAERDHLEQLVGEVNGRFSTVGTSRDPLPAPQRALRRAGGAVPGRRRDARDAAPRRHEPRRQGVRRQPHRRHRRARVERVRGRGPRAAPRDPRQPARPRRHQGRDPRIHRAPARARRPRACDACAAWSAMPTCTPGHAAFWPRCRSRPESRCPDASTAAPP